jgi:hypothetical protein
MYKYRYFATAISLVVVLLLFSACSKEKSYEEMSFYVDEELIGEQLQDGFLGISFHTPKEWLDLTEIVAPVIESNLDDEIENKQFDLEVRKVYGKTDESLFCILTHYDFGDFFANSEEAVDFLASGNSGQGDVLLDGYYTYNGFLIRQVTYRNDSVLSIKLVSVGKENRVFTLEYFVPKDVYFDMLEIIESSIGTLNKI